MADKAETIGQIELRGLKELLLSKIEDLKDRINEKDRLYGERELNGKEAIKAALSAAKALQNAITDASDKAIAKTDLDNKEWRRNANEWRGAMEDREVKFETKTEAKADTGTTNVAIQSLKEAQDKLDGGKMYRNESRLNIGTIVAVICAIVSVISLIMLFVLQ